MSFRTSTHEYVGDPSLDPSYHAKDHMSRAKDLMGSAKDCTNSANTGECGVGGKTLGHETMSCVPLLVVKNIVMFHDLGAAAAYKLYT